MRIEKEAAAPTARTATSSKENKPIVFTPDSIRNQVHHDVNTRADEARSDANSLKPRPTTFIQESAAKPVKERLQPARAVSCRIAPRQLAKQAIRAARDCDPENRAKVLRSVACWWSVHTPPPEAWDYLVGVFVALTGISHAAALEIIDSTRAALGGDAA